MYLQCMYVALWVVYIQGSFVLRNCSTCNAHSGEIGARPTSHAQRFLP